MTPSSARERWSARAVSRSSASLTNAVGTLDNAGTVASSRGAVGTAVAADAGGVVIDRAGSVFVGTVVGSNAGTLELAGAHGTLDALGTSFTGFGTVDVLAGASWTLTGADTLAAGTTLVDSGLLINTGTLAAPVALANNAGVINGSASDTTALITVSGYTNGLFTGGIGTATNFGTIATSSQGTGIQFETGGLITNGSAADPAALITGGSGITFGSDGSIANSGIILGTSATGSGIAIPGTNITNGGNGNRKALIEGAIGISQFTKSYAGFTITNWGTIVGTGGTAISLDSSDGTVIDVAGSIFVGTVSGGGGTLDLAGQHGVLTGLGTQFTGFGLVQLLVGASWSAGGSQTITAGETFVVGSGATFTSNGALSGTGTLAVAGVATFAGASLFDGSFEETGAAVTIGKSLGLTGAATLDGGTIAGVGTLAIAGDVAIDAASLSVSHIDLSAGRLVLGTALDYAGTVTATGGVFYLNGETLTLDGPASLAGATAQGAGNLITRGTASLSAFDVTAGATWMDAGLVLATGSLTLGATGTSGHLQVAAGGIFDLAGTDGIASGGSSNIINAGLFEKTAGSAHSLVISPFGNDGTIAVTSGTLELDGNMSGTGTATIGADSTLRLDLGVVATQTVTFAGADAALTLADASAFLAAIDGFDVGVTGDTIDVTTFGSGTHVTFSQPASGETLATLTNGTRSATLALFGQYSLGGFAARVAVGGTVISYTPPPQATLASSHR